MTATQFSLFNAHPQVCTVDAEPSVNARNAKLQLDTLRSQLATAQADLEDVNYNLSVVTMHQEASREGRSTPIGGKGQCALGCWTSTRNLPIALALTR